MTGSPLHDRELADIARRDRARRRFRPARVDRTSPLWLRLRAACCDISGGVDLDRHADNVFRTVSNTTGHGAPSIHGQGAVPEGGQV